MALLFTKSQLSKFEKLLAQVSLMTLLTLGGGDALAIGDSGGCGFDREYARTLAFGTPSTIESYISENTSRRLTYLKRQSKSDTNDPAAMKAWRDDIRNQMLLQPVPCSHGEFPLDYAVANGNLEVVRWLLDMGADPGAKSPGNRESIFTRCGFGQQSGDAPNGLSKEQIQQRMTEAYRMLLARGANINDPDPLRSITGCLRREMYPLLKQLGARVTVDAFQSWTRSSRAAGGGIVESNWAVVEELAKGQSFDFRGTEFEYGLLTMADARADMSDYEPVIELTRRLSTVVKLSPGIVPGEPANKSDIPKNFSPTRSACYFPEIGAYPSFEFIGLVRKKKDGVPPSREGDITAVSVGKTKEPVLLLLINARETPTKWVIRRTKDAHILGVIALNDRRYSIRDELSFDPLRPAIVGDNGVCQVIIRHPDRQTENDQIKLVPYSAALPSSRTFNPITLRGVPPLSISENDQFVVGDIAPASALISWPESLRTAPPRMRE
jgi:hypothetical protein